MNYRYFIHYDSKKEDDKNIRYISGNAVMVFTSPIRTYDDLQSISSLLERENNDLGKVVIDNFILMEKYR